MCHWLLNGKRQPHSVMHHSQLAVIARTAQGLKSAKLAEGGQPWGRGDWQLQASRGDRGAVSPWSSNLPLGGDGEEISAGWRAQPASRGHLAAFATLLSS
ncbi:uncharacterized [Tachysurus ichikawai]